MKLTKDNMDISIFIKDDESLNLSKLTKSEIGKQFLRDATELYGEANASQLAYRVFKNIRILPNCETCEKPLTSKNFIDFKKGYRKYCSNSCSSRKTHESFKNKLHDFSAQLKLESDFVKYCTDIVEVTNQKCSHKFKVIYRNLFTNDNYCPTCGGKERAFKASKIILERSKIEFDRLLPLVGTNYSTYLKVVRILTAETYKNNIEFLNPLRLTLSKYAFNLDHIVPIIECYRNQIDVYTAASLENLCVITAKENLSKKAKMNLSSTAMLENWKVDGKFIKSNINKLSFDLYLRELNSNLNVNFVPLDNESKLTEDKIYVFEDEWIWKQDIVKSRLLTMSQKAERIYARNCVLRDVSQLESTKFCNENHIQGSVNASIRIGLYNDDILVALMTFGKPRFNKKYNWELLRYCTKRNTTVVGGPSKLLKNFRMNNIGNIITYADRRWSSGNLYRVLGFKELPASAEGYFYVDKDKTRINRLAAQKHKLTNLLGDKFDSNLTELENMKKAGYFRLFDRGNLVFELF